MQVIAISSDNPPRLYPLRVIAFNLPIGLNLLKMYPKKDPKVSRPTSKKILHKFLQNNNNNNNCNNHSSQALKKEYLMKLTKWIWRNYKILSGNKTKESLKWNRNSKSRLQKLVLKQTHQLLLLFRNKWNLFCSCRLKSHLLLKALSIINPLNLLRNYSSLLLNCTKQTSRHLLVVQMVIPHNLIS